MKNITNLYKTSEYCII